MTLKCLRLKRKQTINEQKSSPLISLLNIYKRARVLIGLANMQCPSANFFGRFSATSQFAR